MHGDNISLVKGRGSVIEPFLARIHLYERIKSVTLVSPWMTHLNFKFGDTQKFLSKLDEKKVRLIAITREPEDDSIQEHIEFIKSICSLQFSEVFFIKDLHAKYYVCNALDRSFALIGSPNMYKWTQKAFEIGVTIESRGEGESLIQDLDALTIDLRISKYSKCYKKIGGK